MISSHVKTNFYIQTRLWIRHLSQEKSILVLIFFVIFEEFSLVTIATIVYKHKKRFKWIGCDGKWCVCILTPTSIRKSVPELGIYHKKSQFYWHFYVIFEEFSLVTIATIVYKHRKWLKWIRCDCKWCVYIFTPIFIRTCLVVNTYLGCIFHFWNFSLGYHSNQHSNEWNNGFRIII